MATESSGFDEAMDVGTSTISHLKALKTASTITKAGFGAAGGPFTAAVGIAIANRHGIAKIIIVIIAILLLPVLFILMLPGLIFGSLMEDTGALNSNTIINDNIRASREAIVEVLEESHADILSEINAAIAKLPEGDTASINDSYTYNISVNANLLISQFCASQDNYENINLRKLKSLIRKNKDGLFSYDVATETVTMEVVVEGGAEGENSPEGNENAEPQTKTVTFTRHTYTVQYAGDAYFADHVFHLTDEQKKLAQDYAENLTTFFGNAASGVAMAINLSDEVLSYRPAVERIAAKYGMSEYVELILAVMMQESGGRGLDVMQAAEGSFNTKYPHKPNGITDPEYSIECGIQELKYALEKAGCTGPTDLDRIKLALQGYNYGSGYIDWAMERDGGYTKENAIAYSDMMCARPSWPYDRYGDKEYVEHVLRYYQITNNGGSYPANGMQIPHYLQTDYGNIPYGGGSIASSGCGPTSFAMIASYLTDTTITPADAVAWCGNSYYMPGVGTYWSYFQAAANHFGCGSVTQTSDANQVLQALSEGHPVISSQRAGLFTSGGHFIVLRGVTADSKVLVNDPNDNSSKNYINREFDMMSEVHATSNAYWIFDKK
ncbi:lysozyme family protein [Blautia obeum]|uniref:lysozyme family protein n=1 Tax=Blautia obeum TaxID=40520 RepID=UPI00156F7924|nr:lysozyme family protein [Blautia obeum]NSJ35408.1 peptidase M23 [Blautia obeum]